MGTIIAQWLAGQLKRLGPSIIAAPTVSTVPGALTTLAIVGAFTTVGVAYVVTRRWVIIGRVLSWLTISGLVSTTLAVPLARTPLYLQGISVDQAFRVQYLTRLTDSAALHDLNYPNVAPYYPAGWFWIGGRVGNFLGLDGWEVYKPFAIGSLAVAAAVAVALWSTVVRADRALLVGLVSTVVLLHVGSPEPYGAVVALLLPPVLVLAWLGLRAPDGHGWAALLGVGAFLGLAATFYTLYFGVAVLMVVVLAVAAAVQARSIRPMLRLVPAAAVAGLVALLVWLPFVLAVLRGEPRSGAAQHYLPAYATTLPLPMTELTLLGALTLLGTVWLVVRFRVSPLAQALTVGVLVVYGWTLLSLLVLLQGTTLLAFRLEVPLLVLFACAGVLGLLDVVDAARRFTRQRRVPTRVPVAVLAVVAGVVGLAYTQDVPVSLTNEINLAYTDPDAHGVRADGDPAGDASFYPQLVAAIDAGTAAPQDKTVVLSTDYTLLSYYPYRGFQQITPHYANPLAQYDARAAEIRVLSQASSPEQLVKELDASPWPAPDAFVFRRGSTGLTLSLSRDIYPANPNVQFYDVTFDAALFDGPAFSTTQVGPFTVISRTHR